MRQLVPAIALTILGVSIAPVRGIAGSCKLARIAEFPITMTNLRPLMTAKINDVDVQFLVASGSFYSSISAASAAQLKISTYPLPLGFEVRGIAGVANMSLARVKVFTIAGVPVHDVQFLVGGSEIGSASVGLLGQNILHLGDVEYDLGQGRVRLMKAEDCGGASLAYWGGGTRTAYSVIDIRPDRPLKTQPLGSRIPPTTAQLSHTIGSAYINGAQIRVEFDTGTSTSVLSLKAAARVGIKPDSPGAKYAGSFYGLGSKVIPSYVAPFSSFKLGDEEIRNTRLRIADIDIPDVDMLIGADFFLSHHIYVANSQQKLYFTYSGGPVFNLSATLHPAAQSAPADPSTGEAAPDSATSGAKTAVPDPGTAAEYARRGEAAASRREFDQAVANLTRACELAPEHPEYLYQRGLLYWQVGKRPAAMADFDRALQLKPDDVATLVSRAQLSLLDGDKLHAGVDLDAADAVASKQADARFAMGHAYAAADLLGPAIAQYDLWIASHADDARMPEALNARCWVRALRGTDLALALKDCNEALKHTDARNSLYPRVLDSRGLVLLRLGNYDKSIADYDASVQLNPQDAWSWYGRGMAKLRDKKGADGDADITQAMAITPTIAEEFRRRGIVR